MEMQMQLKSLGMDVLATEPRSLFELFDTDGSGMVDINEFLMGLRRLHGPASAVDTCGIKHGLKLANQNIRMLCSMIQESGLVDPPSHMVSNDLPSKACSKDSTNALIEGSDSKKDSKTAAELQEGLQEGSRSPRRTPRLRVRVPTAA